MSQRGGPEGGWGTCERRGGEERGGEGRDEGEAYGEDIVDPKEPQGEENKDEYGRS
jgi:hypothetical protein